MTGNIGTRLQELVVGDQLGHLEYVVTEENLALFRHAVDYPEARFPSIALAEPARVLTAKYGCLPLRDVHHQEQYFSPPQLNRRVQVTGWLREIYQHFGQNRLVVETFAVDEVGTEILRSRHTFSVGEPNGEETPKGEAGPEVGYPLPSVSKSVHQENIDDFMAAGRLLTSQVGPDPSAPVRSNIDGERGQANCHTGSRAPNQMGFAYLHELLARRFGADFRQGGQLSVTFSGLAYSGDQLTAHGVVSNEEAADLRSRLSLRVWLKNQKGELTATGVAQVTVPSPLT